MFRCRGCAAKESEILYLRAALLDATRGAAAERQELRKDLLAVADRNAASQRAPRPPAEPAAQALTTPAQFSATIYRPEKPLTPEEIEAAFRGPEPAA